MCFGAAYNMLRGYGNVYFGVEDSMLRGHAIVCFGDKDDMLLCALVTKMMYYCVLW